MQQGDIRQNTTESLNARGILSGGDNVAASPEVAAAQAAHQRRAKACWARSKEPAAKKAQDEQNRMAGTRRAVRPARATRWPAESRATYRRNSCSSIRTSSSSGSRQSSRRSASSRRTSAARSRRGSTPRQQVYSGGQMLKSAFGATPTTPAPGYAVDGSDQTRTLVRRLRPDRSAGPQQEGHFKQSVQRRGE
jgi:hypothetical protein